MAKGSRKRSNKTSPREAVITKKSKSIAPLHVREGQLLEKFANMAQNYAKILKQEQQYDFLLQSMNKTRKKIQDGEVTALNIPVAPNTTAPVTEKKEMLAYMDEQIKLINQSLLAIKGQVEHKRDLFIESGLHVKDWCEKRFGEYKQKNVSGYRGKNTTENEKVLFEQAFEDLDMEAFKKAKAEAVKLNKEKEA
jgi:hypothetical protein